MQIEENSKSVLKFAKSCNNLRNDDWDCVVAVTGIEGVGKSSLAIRIVNAINKDADLFKNIVYTSDSNEVSKRVSDRAIKVFMVDEAMRIFYKLNWQTQEQKYLNEIYSTSRKLNVITILCIPRFIDLNEFFRNHRVRIWIHIINRGTAVVFKRLTGAFVKKSPWYWDENWKLEEKSIKRNINIGSYIDTYYRMPNFIGVIKWNKLPTHIEKEYKKISKEAIELSSKPEEILGIRADLWKNRFIKLVVAVLRQGQWNRKNISDEVNMPYVTLNDILPDEFKRKLYLEVDTTAQNEAKDSNLCDVITKTPNSLKTEASNEYLNLTAQRYRVGKKKKEENPNDTPRMPARQES